MATASASGRSARWSVERCGLLETDDEPTTRTKLAATLAEHVPDAEERRWIEPALLTLLGVESGVRSEQLFAAWRTFFERLAATAPVVLVFEDFHYADSGLLDFVDHLLEWSRSVPIYVVTLARPELIERRPGWGAGKRNFNSLYLDPLLRETMHELLAGLVPGLPESATRAIVGRADGIPLYAVETVRMLVADGRLVEQSGAYRPTGDLAHLAVPRDAHRAHREPSRRPRHRGSGPRFRRGCPRPELHAGGPGGRVARRRGRPRAAPPRARRPGADHARGRSALSRTWSIRVCPDADPRGRVQHPGPAGPEGSSPRRGTVPRVTGLRRARGGGCRPLHRRLPERDRGPGSRGTQGAGACRPESGCRASRRIGLTRTGHTLPRAGAHGVRRSGRTGRPP